MGIGRDLVQDLEVVGKGGCAGGGGVTDSVLDGEDDENGGGDGDVAGGVGRQSEPCEYPSDYADPMAFGQPLPPFKWANAVDGLGEAIDLDLAHAQCDTDPDLDWGPFDALLFVSIPAW